MELYPIILKNSSKELRIEGHDLPAPPLSFTTGLNIKKINYPGNPNPTVQVLSEKFNEIEFNGKFRDLDKQEDGYAERRRNELQDFKSMAEETVFQYASQVFIGMIEEITFSTHNIREIEYKIKFNIFTMKLNTTSRVIKDKNPDTKSVIDKASKLKSATNAMQNLSSNITSLHTKLQTSISTIKAQSGLNDINTLISTGNSILVDLKNLKSRVNSISTSTFIDTVNLSSLLHNISDCRQSVYLMVTAAVAQADTNVNAIGEKKTILHIVGKEETLYTIANKYYSDSTLWWKIATENKLLVMELTTGQKLVIPI